jgi:hypothetical protein
MSATLCGTPSAAVKTGTTETFTHDLSAGDNRLVVVLMCWSAVGDNDVTAVTYGGVSMIQRGIQYQSSGTSGSRASMWTLAEASLPADGTGKVVDPTFSRSEAGCEVSCYVWCVQDVVDPVFLTSGAQDTSLVAYPSTVTLTALNAASLIFSASIHNDVSTGALSADRGTMDTELNVAGQIRSRSTYLLDSGTEGDQSIVWSVASESVNTKMAIAILGVEYTIETPPAPSGVGSGWGVLT